MARTRGALARTDGPPQSLRRDVADVHALLLPGQRKRRAAHAASSLIGISIQPRSIGRRRTMNINLKTNVDLAGIRIPDSKLAREITELVRDTESPLLFHHSSRVYYWGALAGKRRGLRFDPELLYAGAMFHDMGLTHQHSST